jgi:hypothetical protein
MVYLRNWEDEKSRLAGVARLSRALVKIARRRCGAAADPGSLVTPPVARRA